MIKRFSRKFVDSMLFAHYKVETYLVFSPKGIVSMTKEAGSATYDPMTPNARRYPRVITPDEINSMPRLTFKRGIDTAIFLSRERDDARYFRQGYCYQEPDHLPYEWDQADFDEPHYCLEGHI